MDEVFQCRCGRSLETAQSRSQHQRHSPGCEPDIAERQARRLRSKAAYGRRHREESKARNRTWPWRKAARAADQARRVAKRYGLPEGDVSKAVFARLHLLPCVYCDVMPAMEVDHVRPMRLGGLNEIANLAPSCPSCNKRRGAFVAHLIQGQASPAVEMWPETDQEEKP